MRKRAKTNVQFGDISLPPGGAKIAKAFRTLLEKKHFESITTAEIATVSGMSEALIYKYFDSKRDLLDHLLLEFHNVYYRDFQMRLKEVDGSLNKLRQLIWEHVNIYERDPVYGRLLVLELSALQGFYESKAYKRIKNDLSVTMQNIIEQGVKDGEIRDDVSIWSIRQSMLGMVHYMCLTQIIFGRQLLTDDITTDICKIFIKGISQNELN